MPTNVEAIRREHVEAFITELLMKRSASTAATRYRGLQQLFSWLTDEGEIARDPMQRMIPPRVEERAIPVVSPDRLRKLLATCEGKAFTDRRDAAILRLFIGCGLRLAEVAQLKVHDIDLDTTEIHVIRKGRREQWLTLTPKAVTCLDRYLRTRHSHPQRASEWLWLGPKGRLTDSGIAQMVKKRCSLASITPIHPHQLRHTWAHILKSKGMSDADLMNRGGWRSHQMLERYGASAADERGRAAIIHFAPGDDL